MLYCIKQTHPVNTFFPFNVILSKIVGTNGALFINHLKNMLEHRPKRISEDGQAWIHEPFKYWATILPSPRGGQSLSEDGFYELVKRLKKLQVIYVTRKTSRSGDDYSNRNWYSINFHKIETLGKRYHADFEYQYRPSSNLKVVVQKNPRLNPGSLNNKININNINQDMSLFSENDKQRPKSEHSVDTVDGVTDTKANINNQKESKCPSQYHPFHSSNPCHVHNEEWINFSKKSKISTQIVHFDTNQDAKHWETYAQVGKKKPKRGRPGYQPKKIGESECQKIDYLNFVITVCMSLTMSKKSFSTDIQTSILLTKILKHLTPILAGYAPLSAELNQIEKENIGQSNTTEISTKNKSRSAKLSKPILLNKDQLKTKTLISNGQKVTSFSTYIKKGGSIVLNAEISPEFQAFWNLYTESFDTDLKQKYQAWPPKKQRLNSMRYARSDKKRLAWKAWKRLKLDEEMQSVVLNKLRERNASIRNWINNPCDSNWMANECHTMASTWLNQLEDNLETEYPMFEVNNDEYNRNKPEWVKQKEFTDRVFSSFLN